jgi:hypothetical protein
VPCAEREHRKNEIRACAADRARRAHESRAGTRSRCAANDRWPANGGTSIAKTNLYRAGVDRGRSARAHRKALTMAKAAVPRLAQDATLTSAAPSRIRRRLTCGFLSPG